MVAGVMGEKADKLNGWYETTVNLQNGKPLFRKLKNHETWLRFTTDPPDTGGHVENLRE